MTPPDDFFAEGVWYSSREALDLVVVLTDVREHLESQPVVTTLAAEVGREEGRLLDKLEP